MREPHYIKVVFPQKNCQKSVITNQPVGQARGGVARRKSDPVTVQLLMCTYNNPKTVNMNSYNSS